MKNGVRYSIIVLLFFIQALFLYSIFRENNRSYMVSITLLSLTILLLYTYMKVQLHEEHQEYESLKVALWVPIGAICSYYLNQVLQLGPVLAAALIGTIASFLPNLRPRSVYLQKLPVAIYCGAFVGMSSPKIAAGPGFILAASMFTAIFLIVSKSIMQGVGGKLGTLAFLGVTITYFLLYFFDGA